LARLITILSLFMIFASSVCRSQEVEQRTFYDEEKSQLKEVYTLKEEGSKVLHGPYSDYFENGNLKTSGQYFDNIANGVWEFYYENGQIRMRGNINNGVNEGQWEYYYENGETSMEGEISNKKRQGDWKMYFDNHASTKKVSTKTYVVYVNIIMMISFVYKFHAVP